MLKLACVLLLTVSGRSLGDSVTVGTTLVQAFVVNRHGDRTPTATSVSLSTNREAVEAASAQYGYGQLTEVGKRRAYEYGQFIRNRYDSLISEKYNRSEIYIRSTDFTRTKMTILVAMAAVYSPYPGSWSEEIRWVPVPFTTVPAKYDFNLATKNCPKFINENKILKMASNSRMDKYADVLAVVANVSSASDLVKYPVTAAFIGYDLYISQQSLGIPLGDEIDAILPQLKEAAAEAVDILIAANDNVIRWNAGVLLNEFFTYASKIIAGVDTPRLRIYSAHDANLYAFIASAQVYPRQGYPKYASAFALELRKINASNKYVVLPVYLPAPGEDPVYLKVDGCDSLLCDLEQFHEVVSKYLLDEDTWRTECGFTSDLVFDDSSIE